MSLINEFIRKSELKNVCNDAINEKIIIVIKSERHM